MSASEHVLLQILAWLLLAATLVALGVACWSVTWPRVKGVVDISILDRESTREDGDVTAKLEDRHYLSYSYTVAGVEFAGSRVFPLAVSWQMHMNNTPVASSAQTTARWYREGVGVDVYYCPAFPRWSCLEPGGFILTALLAMGTTLAFLVM